MAESLVYGAVFVLLCRSKTRKKIEDDDDITLKDSSVTQSFLEEV